MKEKFSGQRFPGHAKLLGFVAGASIALGGVGCTDASTKTSSIPNPDTTPSSLVTPHPSENGTPPIRTDWYLSGGPHYDGLSNGQRDSIDVIPAKSVSCPGGAPLTESPFPSVIDGQVISVGNENNKNDSQHSVVEIKATTGEIVEIMHLADIKVKVGQTVKAGDSLGDPSCEFPPGGSTTGEHIHIAIRDSNNNPIPIEGTVFQQGTIHDLPGNYNGTLEKSGQPIITADTRRCGPDQASIDACGGIRNDIEGFLRILQIPQPTKLLINLKYADGSAVLQSLLDIYQQVQDVNGKATTQGSRLDEESTGTTGQASFNVNPETYVLLFNENGTAVIRGNQFNSATSQPGISDISIKQNQTTTENITLGRITVNMDVDPKNPIKGFFTDHDRPGADVCIDGQDNGKVYEIECVQLSDLNQQGIVGESRAVFDLMPGIYLLRYRWYDATNGWTSYTAKVDNTQGQMKLASGQITGFDCSVYAPENSNPTQPAECSVTPGR